MAALEEYADTPEDIRNFVDVFLQQNEKSLDILRQNCTNDDNKEWVEAAHKFKGGAGLVGAKTLYLLCAQAQNMQKATAAEREEALKNILEEYEKVKNYLSDALS